MPLSAPAAPPVVQSKAIPFITFVIALGVYLITLAPDLTWANFGGDGGELITAAVTLGVPHPPGYPTYVVLGKLVSFLPVGSVALRFNLFSAVCIALAAGLATAVAQPPSVAPPRFPWAALAAGLAFAFTPLVWSQAVITEVYGLNLLVLAAFLWALLGKRPSLLTGGLLGLSFTTHLTSLLMIPLALALTPRRRWPRLGLGVLFGLTPLLLLPRLAQTGSPVVWGDPTTLNGWQRLVTAQLYRANLFAGLPAALPARLLTFAAMLAGQFALVGWFLLGWFWLRRAPATGQTHRRAGWLAATAVLYAALALSYNTDDAHLYFLPGLLLLSILLTPALRPFAAAAILLPLASLLLHFNNINLNNDTAVRLRAEAALQAAPPDAVLLTPGNQTIFTLWYFHHVEGKRPDLILVDANLFAFDWYRARLRQQYPSLCCLEEDDLSDFQEQNQRRRPFIPVDLNKP